MAVTVGLKQISSTESGFMTAAEMEAAALSKLAALKKLYSKQLGYDLLKS